MDGIALVVAAGWVGYPFRKSSGAFAAQGFQMSVSKTVAERMAA